MATFNVFVEGPIDDSPSALPELAEAMSQRYGLSPQDLVSRLKRGRFRVKSNVDAPTAERYKRDLQAIGARVLVEDSALSPTATPVAGTPALRPSSPSLPPANESRGANRPSTPPSGLSAAGPANPRASTPPPVSSSGLAAAGPTHPRASTPPPSSGLAAAFSQELPVAQDLGALGDGSLSLSSLDGEEAPASSGQFDLAPEPEAPVVKIAARPKTPEAPKPKPKPAPASAPMDLFAPPDAGDQNFSVDLAVEEVEERAQKKASAPPENVTSTPMTPVTRRTPVGGMAAQEPVTALPPKQFSRARFAGGIVLAMLIGFIPVHFVANMREKTAFAVVDQKIEAAHASVDSMETWLMLDSAREKLREEKQDKRQMIALTSMLMWAVISAGLAFAFFRFAAPKS